MRFIAMSASSNTEPLLRLNLEAKTKSEIELRRDEILDMIQQ
jgi:phosphomannomutase